MNESMFLKSIVNQVLKSIASQRLKLKPVGSVNLKEMSVILKKSKELSENFCKKYLYEFYMCSHCKGTGFRDEDYYIEKYIYIDAYFLEFCPYCKLLGVETWLDRIIQNDRVE